MAKLKWAFDRAGGSTAAGAAPELLCDSFQANAGCRVPGIDCSVFRVRKALRSSLYEAKERLSQQTGCLTNLTNA